MAITHVQHLKSSASKLATHIGLNGELIVNTDDYDLTVHDGVTPGGWPLRCGGIPSGVTTEMPRPANGASATFTAPTYGYAYVQLSGADAAAGITLQNETLNIRDNGRRDVVNGSMVAMVPARKNDNIVITNTTGAAATWIESKFLHVNTRGGGYLEQELIDRLAGKADIDMSNIAAAGRAAMAHAAMPSAQTVEYSMPVADTPNIPITIGAAPANGWLRYQCISTSTGGIGAGVLPVGRMYVTDSAYQANSHMTVLAPVSAGETMFISYAIRPTNNKITFFYANGNV